MDNTAYDHTYGKVMTLLEAIFPTSNKEQKEAIKSLVNDAFYGSHYYDLSTNFDERTWCSIKNYRSASLKPLPKRLDVNVIRDRIIELFALDHQLGADEVDPSNVKREEGALFVSDDDGSGEGNTFHVSVLPVDIEN